MSITVKNNTRQVRTAIEQAAVAAMTKACLMIEDQAKALTPVDTGQLRSSMTHAISKSGSRIVGKVGSGLRYAIYQEFGTGEYAENGAGRKGGWAYETPDGETHFTRGTRPKKMLRTAFKTKQDKVKQVIADAVKGAVR